jgi:hypothetical protein
MLTDSPMANVFIVLAIAVGVIVVADMIVLPILEVLARGCESGAAGSRAFNASQGRCFGH